MLDAATASDLTVGLLLILATAAVAAASFAIRWFVRAGKCAALQAQAVEDMQRQSAEDRKTHRDLFETASKIRRDLSDLRAEVARLDGRLTSYLQKPQP